MGHYNRLIQQTTTIAETAIAETTTIEDKLSEKTTVLEEIELGLFTGFEDATALQKGQKESDRFFRYSGRSVY